MHYSGETIAGCAQNLVLALYSWMTPVNAWGYVFSGIAPRLAIYKASVLHTHCTMSLAPRVHYYM